MERRTLGRTGEKLSVVGLGGVVLMNETPAHAATYVNEAIKRGVNYFDVAPSYGNAEERLGPAIQPHRKDIFLSCKTLLRTANEVAIELRTTLQRLGARHIDLYQFHAVNTIQIAEQLMGPKGGLSAVIEAQKAGVVRFIGFSSHAEEASLLMMDSFAFDSILFPINFACWQQKHFGQKVVAKAQEKGVGVLALKMLSRRNWAAGETHTWPKCWYKPIETAEDAQKATDFTLSLPVTAAISSGHMEIFRLACDAAEKFTRLSPEQLLQNVNIPDSGPIFPK